MSLSKAKKQRLSSVGFHVFSLALGFPMIYPLLWLVASSFKSNSTMFTNTYSLIPETWDAITNYTSGFKGIGGVPFSTFFFNSVFVTVIGTALTIFCSLLAAYALARIDFAGSKLWFGCVIMTLMIPNQVMIVPQFIILKQLNLVDTKIALILPWAFGYAFFIFQMVQFFRGVPKDLDEAAMIDGCGKIGILFKILVPVAQPSIITCSIFAFYWIWQDFFQPLIFINNPKNYTIPLALNMYLDPNSYNNYGGLFAMSVISIIPVILFFIAFQKYIVEGIATDGIKG